MPGAGLTTASLAMAGSSRSRRASTEPEHWRERIMAKLKTHAGLSEEGIQGLKHALVASSYLKEHGVGPSGILIGMGMKYHRPDGSEYTFQDVPLQAIVESVKRHLRGRTNGISPSRRKEIFDVVMADLPSAYKSKAIWEDEPPPLNPNAKPTTPFSAPKPRSEPAKTNAALIDDLARAAGLNPRQTLAVRGQITWFDGAAGGKVSCSVSVGSWEVRGGRLGRDHTLEDVPTCYVRDRIMDYINDQLPEGKRAAARRAAFSDLNEAEINQYSTLIANERAEAEKPSRELTPLQTAPPPNHHHQQEQEEASIAEYYATVGDWRSLRHLDRQEELLRSIDDTVELTPRPLVVLRRNVSRLHLSRSVIKPGYSNPLPAERLVQVDDDIYHDCDQVRAMIKHFIDGGEWTIDEFRVALGGVSRDQLNTFLGHRGARNGIRCKAFQLCWEFFHRRDKLSLPLVGAGPGRDEDLLQPRAVKRCSTGGGAEECRGGKRPRQV
ncbi:hypothetical protein B0I37DRAFT_400416 [Chaetomium sp. MPI-CAGE-AT-0009]|nr:hypothetical protein B0I37DRAFT_400416 [Chaetomium sp. MPI-CAGE-AT-0009]